MSIRRGGLFLQYDENDEPYPTIDDDLDGPYVLYTDHIAALEQQRIYLAQSAVSSGGYAEGYADALNAAREAVRSVGIQPEQVQQYTAVVAAINALLEDK